MAKRDDRKKPETPPAPFHNPFAKLAGALPDLPPGSELREAEKQSASSGPARAVIRYERKGHGGKEATRVEKLGLARADLERWLRELKQSLGCGGTVDGEDLVLQGDQRERLRPLLEARGVRRVSG